VDLRDLIERVTNRANARVWGASVTYTPLDGAAVSTTPTGDPLVGVFDSAHVVTLEDVDGLTTADRRPMLELILEDLDFTPQRGDKFTLTSGAHSGEGYTVASAEFDSAQAARLIAVKGDFSA
jgi:hypothetical protein